MDLIRHSNDSPDINNNMSLNTKASELEVLLGQYSYLGMYIPKHQSKYWYPKDIAAIRTIHSQLNKECQIEYCSEVPSLVDYLLDDCCTGIDFTPNPSSEGATIIYTNSKGCLKTLQLNIFKTST